MRQPIFTIEIPGRPVSKKNTKKVVRRHGRVIVLYSKLFRDWETEALLTLKQRAAFMTMISEPIEALFVFRFTNHKAEADVSNLIEAPQDILEKSGIIENDRLIQIVHARKEFGFKEPSTWIELYNIGD